MNQIDILLPDDFHVHLRQGPHMATYAKRSAAHFGRILAMPNVIPPLNTAELLKDYIDSVNKALEGMGCEILPCFKLVPGMGADTVLACAKAGAIAGKYYPANTTTNSTDGVSDPMLIKEELDAMEKAGLVLSIHAEDPSAPVMDREHAFLQVVEKIIATHPKLKVVIEHLSTALAVDAVLAWPERVAGTITAHHLAFTMDDLLGDKLDSAYYCKPILKTHKDRNALLEAATSNLPKFFFGSDSAPHSPEAKAAGASGCYTAPIAMSLLAGIFDESWALTKLQAFCSENGARFYGLPLPKKMLRLERQSWHVPDEIDWAIPPAAGRNLGWTARRI